MCVETGCSNQPRGQRSRCRVASQPGQQFRRCVCQRTRSRQLPVRIDRYQHVENLTCSVIGKRSRFFSRTFNRSLDRFAIVLGLRDNSEAENGRCQHDSRQWNE